MATAQEMYSSRDVSSILDGLREELGKYIKKARTVCLTLLESACCQALQHRCPHCDLLCSSDLKYDGISDTSLTLAATHMTCSND